METGGYKRVQRVLLLVLFLNLLVAGIKIIVGSAIQSASLIADGFHSLSDCFSNIVGLIGIYFASQPEDEDHPYGHHKFETLAGMVISLMLILAGGKIVLGAFERFRNPNVLEVSTESLIFLAITLAFHAVIFAIEHTKGKLLNSQILLSDSMHTKGDVFVSAGVLVTLAAIRLGFPPVIDPVVSLVVASIILHAGYEIFKETSGVLVDSAAVDPGEVREIVMGFEDIKEVYNIRSRGCRNNLCIDLHIMVDPGLDVQRTHKLVHDIEDAIRAKFSARAKLTAHVEPHEE